MTDRMINEEAKVYHVVIAFILFFIAINSMVKSVMSQFVTDTEYRLTYLEEKIINLKENIDDLEFNLQDKIRNL